MKDYKIAVQRELKDVIKVLEDNGFDVVIYEDYDGPVSVTILSGISSEYEEIEPAQCRVMGPDNEKVLIIDSTGITPEKVLSYVQKIKC